MDSTAAVLNAVARLRATDPAPLSQGLGPDNARHCLDAAADAITAEALAGPPSTRHVGVLVAHGVFTSPLEWTALLAARGCRVTLKAPSRDPAFCRALSEAMRAEGLDVGWTTDRAVEVEAWVAMGSDETVASLDHPRVDAHGHKFSVAFVRGQPSLELARDHALYDTRGCMAPAAVFTTSPPDVLARDLVQAMRAAQLRWPRGEVDPALGPEWRRRVGLARALGAAWEEEGWAVCVVPAEHFTPVALPRMVTVHPVVTSQMFREILAPYRPWLSTCGTDSGQDLPEFCRVCLPGSMQTPPLPRHHDGRPMDAVLAL